VHDSRASLAAGVGILALCLRDDRDIWDILAAPGTEESLWPGLTVVNHGTGVPGENGKIAAYLAEKGVTYLDAPRQRRRRRRPRAP
jgi:3-hydroxyisobutyrate dehydrogenase-like beta-hydroxyacid dehydrogenase